MVSFNGMFCDLSLYILLVTLTKSFGLLDIEAVLLDERLQQNLLLFTMALRFFETLFQ